MINRTLAAILLAMGICLQLQASEPIAHVSMFALIANPESYEGKTVTVDGFFIQKSPAQKFLFNNISDYKGFLYKNSIWVELSDALEFQEQVVHGGSLAKVKTISDLNIIYIRVTGEFVFNRSYTSSPMPTGIIKITDVKRVLETRETLELSNAIKESLKKAK